MSTTLDKGGTVKLPTNLSNNQLKIESSGTVNVSKTSATSSTILEIYNNLQKYDTLLRITFDRYEDKIFVINRSSAGDEGPKVQLPSLERAFGPNLTSGTVTIKDVGSSYQVFVNKNYLCTYQKTLGGDGAQVHYDVTGNQPSVLADQLTLTVE